MTRAWSCGQAWIGVAALLATAAGSLTAARPARACSCIETSGHLVWPRRDTVGVPIDTPLVVERKSFDGDVSGIAVRLVDEQGAEVALNETRVHEHPPLGSCWAHETMFLRPAEPLAADARYTMFVGDSEEGQSFTTGAALFEPPEYPTPIIRYMHTGSLEACMNEGNACELGELYVTFDAPIPDGVWLRMRSAAEINNDNRWLYASREWAPAQGGVPQLGVVLPSGEKCIELGLYGVDGSVVLEREVCEPDVCVLYSSRGFSTCGEPPSSALDMRRVPSLGCDEPVVIEDGIGGPIYPEPEPNMPDAGPVDSGMPSAGAGGGDEPVGNSGGAPASGAGGEVAGSSGAAGTSSDDELEEDPEMERETVTACSCGIVGGQRGVVPACGWLLGLLGLARLGRRLSNIRNQ